MAAHTRFGVAHVDHVILDEIRMQGDVAQATLAAVRDVRHAIDVRGLLTVLGDDEEGAFLFRHQHAAVWQEGEGPWLVEGGNRLDREWQVRLCLRAGRHHDAREEQPIH